LNNDLWSLRDHETRSQKINLGATGNNNV
jgi:hypothetical protein